MDSSEFAGAFLEELDEQLLEMEQKIIELEENGGEETVQDLFRVAHTLKGSCAAMGFNDMKDLTHEMEQVLHEVRSHRLRVSGTMTELLLQCFDGLKSFQEALLAKRPSTVQTDGLILALRKFLEQSHSHDGGGESGKGKAAQTFVVRFAFSPDSVMRGIRAYIAVEALRELGDVIAVTPNVDAMEEAEDTAVAAFEVVVETSAEPDRIKAGVVSSEFRQIEIQCMKPDEEDKSGVTNMVTESVEMNLPQQTVQEASSVTLPSEHVPVRKSHSVRVEIEQLETLMNLVGELVIDQARIERVNRSLSKKYRADDEVTTLGDISTHVSRVVGELQESIMMARMLPIESLFKRFPRVVRDLAHTLDKRVRLVLEGKETRLDRTVIEEIADPLIHLIRNAVDHGIEPSSVRRERGKLEEGTLHLAARHEDNKVILTIRDDGAGMDAEQLRKAVIEKGLMSAEEVSRLTDTEVLYLIFKPGFSTAKKLSDVSGRGVGMDIVRNHIERLGGTIEIETKLGIGSVFRITLPLTVAIISALLVRVSDETFVIPISNVLEIVRVDPQSIQSVRGRPTILLRGQATSVVSLQKYFGLAPETTNKTYIPLVVVGMADKRVAIVVDELYGNQEIVKKSLTERVGSPRGIGGATILGDGKVGLILDIGTVCEDSQTGVYQSGAYASVGGA